MGSDLKVKKYAVSTLSIFAFIGFLASTALGNPLVEAKAALMTAAQDPKADFYEALKLAEESGVGEAAIVEARFINLLRSGNLESLIAFIPKVEAQLDYFDVGIGKGFISREQAQGFVDTLKALEATRDEDEAAFTELYVSAFLNAPNFAQNVGLAQIQAERQAKKVMDLAAANVVIPMDMVISSVEGESKTLADWMGDNKALLIDFWASWCGPCIRLMPELKEKATVLSGQGIYVAAMNTDDEDQLNKARETREKHEMESVNWLIDPDGTELSSVLYINSIPRMVLIDPNGKTLFNGHPMDEELIEALAAVGATLPDEE